MRLLVIVVACLASAACIGVGIYFDALVAWSGFAVSLGVVSLGADLINFRSARQAVEPEQIAGFLEQEQGIRMLYRLYAGGFMDVVAELLLLVLLWCVMAPQNQLAFYLGFICHVSALVGIAAINLSPQRGDEGVEPDDEAGDTL